MIRCLILCLIPVSVLAQNYAYFAGSRSAALAHGSVALVDAWSTHHNQAALGFVDKTNLAISYENRFLLADLSLANASFSHPTKLGTFGLAISYFGFELYNETKIGLNYSRAFGSKISFGLQLNLEDYYVSEGSSAKPRLGFEFGILAKPVEKLNLGFHMYNPSGAEKNIETNERKAIIVRLGLAYEFSKELTAVAEIKKHELSKEHYVIGFEYQFIELLCFRTGIGLQPLTNTFGLGLNLGEFECDLSYEYAQDLGSNANISLQFAF